MTTARSTATSTAENPWAGQGAVLLDIGGDVGALVVAMPETAVGLEVEIRPLDPAAGIRHGPHHVHQHDHLQDHQHDDDHGHQHGHLAHVAVVARPVAGGRQPSLVYGELPSGRYELFEKGCPDAVALRVDITGARVTTASWPG